MKISRNLAICILKYCHEHKKFYFPFTVVCREYSPEDDDFVEIESEEWNMIALDPSYRTFELWENLQDLRGASGGAGAEGTTELLAKGFIERITEAEESPKTSK